MEEIANEMRASRQTISDIVKAYRSHGLIFKTISRHTKKSILTKRDKAKIYLRKYKQ